MTDSLPDKPNKTTDEAIRTLRTGLRLIPFGIGSALDFQIFDRMAARDRERLQAFVESLAGDVKGLASERPDFLKQEFFDTDEFRFILREVFTRAAREHREEKVAAFRAALLNSMGNDPRVDFDRKVFLLDTLNALTEDQLSILRHLHRFTRATDPASSPRVYDICRAFNARDAVSRSYIHACLDGMATRRLLNDGALPSPGLRRLRVASGRRDPMSVRAQVSEHEKQSYVISALGVAFVDFVSTSGDQADYVTAPRADARST